MKKSKKKNSSKRHSPAHNPQKAQLPNPEVSLSCCAACAPAENIKAKSFELTVEGMHCAACASGIEKHLRKIGLDEVSLSFSSKLLTFRSTHEDILPRVSAEIEKLGYKVLKTNASGSSVSKQAFWSLRNKFIFCLVFTLPLLAQK